MKSLKAPLIFLALTSCGDRTQAWMVVTFSLPDGQSAQMAFNNPDPSISQDECEQMLPWSIDSLIQAAHHKEPRLRSAKFTGAHCVMSSLDPIKQS